jgi:hypothetical protein
MTAMPPHKPSFGEGIWPHLVGVLAAVLLFSGMVLSGEIKLWVTVVLSIFFVGETALAYWKFRNRDRSY